LKLAKNESFEIAEVAATTSLGCPPGATRVDFFGILHHKIYRAPWLASNRCRGTFVA